MFREHTLIIRSIRCWVAAYGFLHQVLVWVVVVFLTQYCARDKIEKNEMGWSGVHVAGLACNADTTPTQPHRISNTHRTKNVTTNVVIQQHSCKLLMMDILISETCWAHKKWNKIASDIKLVFYSSTITMMHGPINIKKKIHIAELCYNDLSLCNTLATMLYILWC